MIREEFLTLEVMPLREEWAAADAVAEKLVSVIMEMREKASSKHEVSRTTRRRSATRRRPSTFDKSKGE
jgi:hypothetical protein